MARLMGSARVATTAKQSRATNIDAERRQLWRDVFVAAIASRSHWDDADAERLAVAAVLRFDRFCLDKPEGDGGRPPDPRTEY